MRLDERLLGRAAFARNVGAGQDQLSVFALVLAGALELGLLPALDHEGRSDLQAGWFADARIERGVDQIARLCVVDAEEYLLIGRAVVLDLPLQRILILLLELLIFLVDVVIARRV